MRYSSAFVLSTLAVGQAAAANIRHAGFHARRAAEHKRDADYNNVNWNDVSYDLSHVDWSSVFATPTPTPTPSPESVPKPSKEEVKAQAIATTPAYTAPAAATSTQAEKPKETKGSQTGDLVDGVLQYFQGLGATWASNDKFDVNSLVPTQPNGEMWLNGDSNWKQTFINDGSEDITVMCWSKDKMFISGGAPNLAFKLGSGSKQTVSFGNVSGGCAPAYKDTKMTFAGLLGQSWLEFTFAPTYGVFDISKEVDMNGRSFTAKGSKCTSDDDTCVFKCVNGANNCMKKEDYKIFNCGAQHGGGAGIAADGGSSGGCMMGESSEHIKVTFN